MCGISKGFGRETLVWRQQVERVFLPQEGEVKEGPQGLELHP